MLKPDKSWYLSGLKKGDPEVLRALTRNCGRTLASWVRWKGGSLEDSKEAVQYALVHTWKNASVYGFEFTSSVCVYFNSIGRNYWKNEIRKRKTRKNVTEKDLPLYNNQKEDPLKLLEKAERYKFILDKMEELDDICKGFLPKVLFGKTVEEDREIAESLGLSYANFRQKKSRCRGKLIELIKNDPRFEELFKDLGWTK